MVTRAKQHLAERQALVIKAHVDQLDERARMLESKWGVGRLPLLVAPELAARFWAQQEIVNRALWDEGTPEAVAVACQAMLRAWEYLDGQATANGAQPLPMAVWETVTPDGQAVIIAKDDASASQAVRDGRAAVVFTLEEIGKVLASQTLLAKCKEAFPGGKVVAVRARRPDNGLDDEIPF